MGKEQVYFKQSREKAITRKDRKDDIKSRRDKKPVFIKSKNISKKDADEIRK